MKTGTALLISFGVFVVMMLFWWLIPILGFLIFIGTAIWAGVDANKIGLKKYKVGGPTSPAITVLGCLLLWIIAFPWYMVNKGKIARGEVSLKDEHITQIDASEPSLSKTVQPRGDTLAQLEKLGQLKEKGVLSDEEFQAEKSKLLS